MRAKTTPRAATMLTLLILLLLPVASGIGLFVPGFYRDTAWSVPQARGQDLVTLFVAEPLLIAALAWARRGGARAQALWAGTLGYVLYTYALFSYTAYFNALFLAYVALFSAALFALLALAAWLDPVPFTSAASAERKMPVRAVAIFLAAVGLLFALAWLGQIVPALLRGRVPESVALAQTPTNGVYVQDLAVLIPLLLLAGHGLWRRRLWGMVLGAALLVTMDVLGAAIVAMAFFMDGAGIAGSLATAGMFAVVTAASLGCTAVVFVRLPGRMAWALSATGCPLADAAGEAGRAPTATGMSAMPGEPRGMDGDAAGVRAPGGAGLAPTRGRVAGYPAS